MHSRQLLKGADTAKTEIHGQAAAHQHSISGDGGRARDSRGELLQFLQLQKFRSNLNDFLGGFEGKH